MEQIVWLFILAIPIATIAWTVTHEDLFAEFNRFCVNCSKSGNFFKRKFFYLFTCEYCFSFYVSIIFLAITKYHLMFDDWRGYLIACFSLMWVANIYMNLHSRLRIDIKSEKADVDLKEEKLNSKK